MKTLKFILFAFCSIQFCAAQSNSFNYKALVKDDLGNVVANQTVTVQFEVLENTTTVYTETHTTTTDANGLVILDIGTGTSGDDFDDINWNTYNHNLNVQIDIGSGLVDLGTTAFKTVPYAAYADNITGLEKIDEGSGGPGWRIKGFTPSAYGNIGWEAVDLSRSNVVSSTNGATGTSSDAFGTRTTASGDLSTALGHTSTASGIVSTAMGNNTTASGQYATALGDGTLASGNISTSMGGQTNASGTYTTAMGRDTQAIGNYSSAMGRSSKSEASYSTSMGRYNIGGGNASSWVETDPLFEIGNGTGDNNRSNTLTVLKNGTITAPSFDISEITDDKALITKEYADNNLISSGLEALDEGLGIGWRLKSQNPLNYGKIGDKSVDLSYSNTTSTTFGATGGRSFTSGQETIASGLYSTAMGVGSTASGIAATAMGSGTTASNNGSTAMGGTTIASGLISTAMGQGTKAEAAYSTVIGRYNIGGGNANSWQSTDPLFEIGSGTDDASRNNAITVLKNGKVGIGTHQPTGFLEVSSINSSTEPTVKLVHEGTTGARINFTNTDVTNGNRWTLYGDPNDVDSNSFFTIAHPNIGTVFRLQGDGRVGIGSTPSYRLDVRKDEAGDFVAQVYNTSTNANADGLKIRLGRTSAPTSSNSYVAFFDGNNTSRGRIQGNGTGVTYATTSDRRLKTNITDITDALALIRKIQPRQYEYKTNRGVNEYGFIAQELQLLYVQAVTGSPNSNVEDNPMMVDYGRLTPLLTAGIKELNDKVKSLEAENTELKQKLNKLEQLEARLSALETTSNQNEINLIDKK